MKGSVRKTIKRKQANLITTDVAVYFRAMCGALVNEEALSKLWKAMKAMRLNFVQNVIWCFVGKNYPNKDLSLSKSEKVYTRLYLNKLESIMCALSNAWPTGHQATAHPTLQLHFGCRRATPPVNHSYNWPSGRMQHFLFKIGQKSYFLPIKTQKLILTLEWYYRSLYCHSKTMI